MSISITIPVTFTLADEVYKKLYDSHMSHYLIEEMADIMYDSLRRESPERDINEFVLRLIEATDDYMRDLEMDQQV